MVFHRSSHTRETPSESVGRQIMKTKGQDRDESFEEQFEERPSQTSSKNPVHKFISWLTYDWQEAEELKEHSGKLEDQIEQLKTQSKQREQEHYKVVEQYEMIISDMRKQYEKQEKRIRTAQDAMKKSTRRENSVVLSDEDMTRYFSRKQELFRQIARKHAHMDIGRISGLQNPEKEEFFDLVNRCMHLEDQCLPAELVEGPRAKNTPALLLQALVADFVFRSALARPFWIGDAVAQWRTAHPDDVLRLAEVGITTEHFEQIQQFLLYVAPHEAQCWRAHTMRVLSMSSIAMPSTETGGQAVNLLKDIVGSYHNSLVQEFLRGSVCHLLDEPKSCHSELFSLLFGELQSTSEFASRIWSQGSLPTLLSMEQFVELAQATPLRFKHDNQQMSLHPSQRPSSTQCGDNGDDEDEFQIEQEAKGRLYDGLPVKLLLQPAVVAYGNENFENYDELTRVWCPAVVWVEGTRDRSKRKREEDGRQCKRY